MVGKEVCIFLVRLARRGNDEVACLVGWGNNSGDARGWGHGGMLGIFILVGAGTYGILVGGEAVGTLGGGRAVVSITLGGRAGRPDQWVIGGMVGVTGLEMGRAKCMILDNCISACVCSYKIVQLVKQDAGVVEQR